MERIKNTINKILSKMWVSNNFILHGISDSIYNIICFIYKIIYYPPRSEFFKAIDTYGNKEDKKNPNTCIRKMRHDWMKYGLQPDYYFIYNFANLPSKKRKTYLTSISLGKYSSILLYDREKATKIFDHKYNTYRKFKKYYKRDIIKSQDMDEQFLRKHPRFFFKPEKSSHGFGARIVSIEDFSSIQDMKESIPDWNDGLCEELIIQDEWMNAFHSKGVNAVRMQTMTMLNGNVIIFGAALKMSRGDAIVDNLVAGGLVADINIRTGEIISNGVDNWGREYHKHPDTGAVIKGAMIPKWEEARQIALNVAKTIPTVRYISLDMALTKNGWIIIEGNVRGEFLRQVCNKRGYKKEFEKLIMK